MPRTRFLEPDAEIRSDNLEWAFRGSHKWMCGEGGEITLTRNHLIMEIISCHWYQSSFYVVGWIYACMLCSGGVGFGGGIWGRRTVQFLRSDAALACDCSVCDDWPTLPTWHSLQKTILTWMNEMLLMLFHLNKQRNRWKTREENVSCRSRAWLPVSCSPLQRKASTSWRFWFPAMRRGRSLGREVRPSSSCRKRLEPPSNCQNPKTSTPVSAHHWFIDS